MEVVTYHDNGNIHVQFQMDEHGMRTSPVRALLPDGGLEVVVTVGSETIPVYRFRGGDNEFVFDPRDIDWSFNGTYTLYRPDGSVRSEQDIFYGDECGKSTKYYEDGSVKYVAQTDLRHRELRATEYHRDGTLKCTWGSCDGLLYGKYMRRREDGTIEASGIYEHNMRIGKWIVDGEVKWYGMKIPTLGQEVTKEEHDGEMREKWRPYEERLFMWRLVARRMGVSKDITNLIGEMLFDGVCTAEYDCYLEWRAEKEQ